MTRPTPATPPKTTARMGANGDAVSETADDRTLGLEDVIAAHRPTQFSLVSQYGSWHLTCSCEQWVCDCEDQTSIEDGECIHDDQHAAHVAERVRAHLAPLGALADEFDSEVDWSSGRNNYGDNEAWESAARQLRAALAATLGEGK